MPCILYASDTVSIFFLGDTHFGENYQRSPVFNRGTNVIEEYGYDYFFENVETLLIESEFTVANLETPLTEPLFAEPLSNSPSLTENRLKKQIFFPASYVKPYLHYSSPVYTPVYLKKYNIFAVSLGNNHTMDYGTEGLTRTITALTESGIGYFGAGIDYRSSGKPLITDINGFTLAIFGGFEYRLKYDSVYNFYSSPEGKAGVYKLLRDELAERIKDFRKDNPETFIVIFPHWGSNYRSAGEEQKVNAEAWIDAGADLIIGHGAHTIQKTGFYKGKVILYNIGNFIFNAPGRYGSTGALPYGFMVNLVITNSSKILRLYPVYTDNMQTDYRLRFTDEEEFEECFEYLVKNNSGCIIRKSLQGRIEIPL